MRNPLPGLSTPDHITTKTSKQKITGSARRQPVSPALISFRLMFEQSEASNQAGLNRHWDGSWALVKGKSRRLRHLQKRLRNSPKAGRLAPPLNISPYKSCDGKLVTGVLAWAHAEAVTFERFHEATGGKDPL
jgi:hypothetical protein